MCPKPFSWAKNKRKRFSDGKSRGPLLTRVTLNCSKSAKTKLEQITPILGIHFLKVQTTIGQNRIKIHGILLALEIFVGSAFFELISAF